MFMGHSIGLDDHYFTPGENYVLQEYLKAANFLTINQENRLKLENLEFKKRNTALESDRDEVLSLRRELESLLELKKTLEEQGILKVT
jgi:hypothetical protein